MIARYPDIDDESQLSVLPPAVQHGLARLAKELGRGRLDRGNLKTILDGLSELPLAAVIQTDREIPLRTWLWEYERFTSRTLLDEILRRTPRHVLSHVEDLAYIFVCHGNGYLREAALKRLKKPPQSAFLFALVAYQLNDWVPQVRDAARKWLLRVMPLTEHGVVAEAAMCLLQYRGFWIRGKAEAEVLDSVVVHPETRRSLVDMIATRHEGAPHRTLVAVLARPEIDADLPRLMTGAAHPEVRTLAARALISGLARWPVGRERIWIDKSMGISRAVLRFGTRPVDNAIEVETLIAQAAGDRAVQVRKVAMQALIDGQDLWEARRDLIDQMAKDRSPAIRAGIDYILRHRSSS